MNLDLPVDLRRYGTRPLWLLIAAAAARCSTERDAAGGLAAFLFWSLVFAACWQLRAVLRRGRNPAKAVEQAGNAAAAFGLLLFLLHLLQADLVPAVLALLFSGQAALLLIAQKRQHLWLLLGAALATVLFAASASRSALFLPCLAWFTFVALGLLTADHALERSLRVAAQPLDEDGPQAARLGGGGAVFAVATLAVALPLYLFMPQPQALLLGGMQASTAHDYSEPNESGQPVDAHPGDDDAPLRTALRGLAADPSAGANDAAGAATPAVYADSFPINGGGKGLGNGVVMYVRSTQPVYLRGKLFNRFEHDRWFRDRGQPESRELQQGYYNSLLPSSGNTRIEQQIEVVSPLDAALYTAPGLYRLRFPGTVLHEYADGTLELPRPLQADTSYSAEARLDLLQGRYLLPQEAPADAAAYLQLPADFTPRIRELAQQVTAAADGPAAKALALEHFLRGEYRYSVDTIIPYQGVTPLDWFLFEHRSGHCEFFASAVVTMLRSLGIPARLATGFSLGEKNPVTGYYEVRAMDGHAWGEVYLAGRGWMMLEPTPFYPLPATQPPNQVAAKADRYLDRMADTSATLDPRALRTAAIAALRDVWHQLRALQAEAAWALQALGWKLPALILAAAAAALCAWLLRLSWLDRIDNRRVLALLDRAANAPGADGALHAAAALERSFGARDAARPPGDTLREFYADLRLRHPTLPPNFADWFDDARYGGAAQADAGVLAGVAGLVRTQLALRPRPRFRRQLESWRALLHWKRLP